MTLYRSTYDGDRDIVGLLNELLGYVSPYFREKWDLEAQVAAVMPVEPCEHGVELCIYHGWPRKETYLAHCRAVWQNNAEYPNGDCVYGTWIHETCPGAGVGGETP